MRRPPEHGRKARPDPELTRDQEPIRIIGGVLRGRKLAYSGEFRTRPMKERVRESVFNLIGDDIQGKHAVDLFAGTGALGLEAISRGATSATFVEQHFPTADLIHSNARALAVAERCEIVGANTFIWAMRQQPAASVPCVVFCSPPYSFYVERTQEMLDLVRRFIDRSPPTSIFVVESDAQFDPSQLPDGGRWDVRSYPPAQIAIYRKPAA